ncbi:MAG: alcohol dehydrogenase [Gammaproteobacteria bacterium RIFCSPLOWO2_02_47_7]|nr:MAG: alcohol dehydrogenase [Gammaproteobacteria bacterium RIFCSPLOWO2_02_47_7]
MHAMVLKQQGTPLVHEEVSLPVCSPDEVLIRVLACGVCRTDLHICDGDLVEPKLPLIPGHEIAGEVVECGTAVTTLKTGQRVGVPWLGYTCGICQYCREGHENLCDNARFTGYHMDGGYAEYTLAHQQYVFPLPDTVSPVATAPLLCAGLIGYRSLNMAGGGASRLGIYGFGAAAHIITQVAVYQGREVYAFTRKDDAVSQAFAMTLGAVWAGDSAQNPPVRLDAAIIFAPVGDLVPRALSVVRKGGIIVCAGIHMTDIPAFPYLLLWGERSIKSVANLTRQDGDEFLALAARIPVRTETESFPLQDANEALDKLRNGAIKGAAVLVMK